jgi:hypothetical protein
MNGRHPPLRKNTPESAEAFAEKAYALMPHVKITELLAEVEAEALSDLAPTDRAGARP